mmetsp:Transcript_37531/g.105986  ORF Transcript_37531/g.105986 Transcript_37531/m.105986 type:complete len:333 (-) Transcript_37531:682-1680(-)
MAFVAQRVCIVVEATAAMAKYFTELRTTWLEPLLRGCQKHHAPNVEFSLVLYGTTHHSEFVVQRGKWTPGVDDLLDWLDGVVFTGGCHKPTAFAHALAEAVYLCKMSHNFGSTASIQSHIIVMAVTEPSREEIPWPYPGAINGMTSFTQLVKELKPGHNITLSLMQGGGNSKVRGMFRMSQGNAFRERRHVLSSPNLYVHTSFHWADALQWLIDHHGKDILGQPGAGPAPAAVQAQPVASAPGMQQQGGGLQRATALQTAQPSPQMPIQPGMVTAAGAHQQQQHQPAGFPVQLQQQQAHIQQQAQIPHQQQLQQPPAPLPSPKGQRLLWQHV